MKPDDTDSGRLAGAGIRNNQKEHATHGMLFLIIRVRAYSSTGSAWAVSRASAVMMSIGVVILMLA